MKRLLLLISFLPFLNAKAQTGLDFRDFHVNGKRIEIEAVSMKVEDKATKKVVFDGYKQGRVIISNSGDEPMLATFEIDLGGYFKMSSGRVYSLNVEYKEVQTSATYFIIDDLDNNKMASLLLIYSNGELNSVYVITLPNVKDSKKGLVVKLYGLEKKIVKYGEY